jgi:hypothetical protein
MTPRHSILLAFILATSCFTSSCSEKSRASVRALHNQAEDELASFAGEGRVAMELMKSEYQYCKERLVTIKTQKRSYERRAGEREALAKQMDQEGKPEKAPVQRELAATDRTRVEMLSRKDLAATEALKSFAAEYQAFEERITMIEEELESDKAIGGLGDNLGVDNPSKARMETIGDMEKKLKEKLDRAKSIVEVQEIEEEL